MVSKITIIGVPIFVIGLLMLILLTFLGFPAIPPFITSSPQLTDTVTVPAGSTRTVSLMDGNISPTPFPIIVKGIFIIESDTDYNAMTTLMHSSTELGEQPTAIGTFGDLYTDPLGDGSPQSFQKTLQVTLIPPGTSVSFNLKIDVQNTGSTDIKIRTRVDQVVSVVLATILPAIIAVIGFLLIIVGLITGRGKKVDVAKRPKAVPGGWEPTLQWGGGSSTSSGATTGKRPKMAIKGLRFFCWLSSPILLELGFMLAIAVVILPWM